VEWIAVACGAASALAGVYLGALAYGRGVADRGIGPRAAEPEPGDIFSPTRQAEIDEERRLRPEMDEP